jgi:hypothetical protein
MTKRPFAVFIVGFLIMASVPLCGAGHEVEPAFVLGNGLFSCDKWTKDHAVNGREYEEDVQWLFGFISGFNKYYRVLQRPFLTQDERVLVKAIDRRCTGSPNTLIAEEVVNFLDDLKHVGPSTGSQ